MPLARLAGRLSRIAFALLLALFCLAAAPGAHEQPDAAPLRVGAAVSLQEVLQDIAGKYTQRTGQAVGFTFGSSGQVMGQIRNGAAIDLFISAAHQQVDALARQKLIDELSRRVVATNALVLIVPAGGADVPGGFAGLSGAGVRRLAMGEPKTVPAGQYAQQVLDHLKLADPLRSRLTYGTSVRQVLAYVERGEVDAGIVYRTDAMRSGEKVRVVATADPAWHEPIEYPAAIVAGSDNAIAAGAFLEFLATPEARAVLEAHGFGAPSEQPATRPGRE